MANNEYVSFESLITDGRWVPATVDEQLVNLRTWQEDGLIPELPLRDRDTAAAIDDHFKTIPLEGPNSLVVTPYLSSTHETARQLWQIIARDIGQANAIVVEEAFLEQPDGRRLILGTDEALPAGVLAHSNDKFIHSGPRQTPRPAMGIAASVIDLDAHLGEVIHGNPTPPYAVRTPGAPHVEILSILAHNQDLVRVMAQDEEPWVWLPGLHVHNVHGHSTAMTSLITAGDGEIRIVSSWNDGGIYEAPIPEFAAVPYQL